jgi:hypothetical protein
MSSIPHWRNTPQYNPISYQYPKSSYSSIDNIFINTFKFTNFTVYPVVNGLTDHDAQNLIIHNIFKQNHIKGYYRIWEINDVSIADFNNKLSYESWDDVIAENDINTTFNIFLNVYLTIFRSIFPLKKVHTQSISKAWLTPGIGILYANKKKASYSPKK